MTTEPTRSPADLEAIHQFSSGHRDLLGRSNRAGCFHCGTFFDPANIREWVDVRNGDDGVTALCPHCGIDAVLPAAAPITLSAPMLAEMRRHWF